MMRLLNLFGTPGVAWRRSVLKEGQRKARAPWKRTGLEATKLVTPPIAFYRVIFPELDFLLPNLLKISFLSELNEPNSLDDKSRFISR